MGTPQAGVFDFVRHLKAPHGLSVVLALGVAFVAIGAVFLLIGEEAYAALGAPARAAVCRRCSFDRPLNKPVPNGPLSGAANGQPGKRNKTGQPNQRQTFERASDVYRASLLRQHLLLARLLISHHFVVYVNG